MRIFFFSLWRKTKIGVLKLCSFQQTIFAKFFYAFVFKDFRAWEVARGRDRETYNMLPTLTLGDYAGWSSEQDLFLFLFLLVFFLDWREKTPKKAFDSWAKEPIEHTGSAEQVYKVIKNFLMLENIILLLSSRNFLTDTNIAYKNYNFGQSSSINTFKSILSYKRAAYIL